MRIRRIFERTKEELFAVAYDDSPVDEDGAPINEIERLQQLWEDPEWLFEFFTAHIQDLQSDIYGSISVEDAIERTQEEADELFERLLECSFEELKQLFKPLDNRAFELRDFQEQKAYGSRRKSWLRLYAIHYYDKYVITGGAIKLTKRMEDRPHTQLELEKLRVVRDALKYNEAEDKFVYLDL